MEGYPGAHRRYPARSRAQGHRHPRHRQRPGRRAARKSSSAAPASGATRCSRSFRPRALEFLKIQGLGPKSIALIFEHFRISTIDELERLCQEQKLRELPRMGAKLEEKVLRSIAQYRQRTGRYLLSYAEGVAAELMRDAARRCPAWTR